MRTIRICYRRLAAVLRERNGVAAVEFALMLPFIGAMITPMVDLGLGYYARTQVQDAAQAGAQYAYLKGPPPDFNKITAAVTGATTMAGLSAAPAPSQSWGCAIAATPTSPPTINPAGQGTTCPDGQPAGNYITVNAQAVYTPLLPYPVIGATVTLTATSTVRIQ